MTSKTYDRLKWVSLVFLPALASAYFALGQLWHFPAVEEVVGTITILDTFLGLLLGKSSQDFQNRTNDPVFMGDIVVVQEVDGHPATIRLDPKDKIPVFQEGRPALFNVKRETLT